jgi:hypothetical protein
MANELGGACRTHRIYLKFMKYITQNTQNGKEYVEVLGLDGGQY